MRPKNQTSGVSITSPLWAGQFINDRLLPGGGWLEESEFTENAEGKKYVQSGTLIGRTYAERDAGTGYGPADVAVDEEIYLMAMDVVDAANDPECELFLHESVVKEKYLPDWEDMTAEEKTFIRDKYFTILGTD